MSYCTPEDYVARYGDAELVQLTDRLGIGLADAQVFADAADDAGAEIDAYLAPLMPVPLTVVPRLLVRVAIDIVRFRLQGDAPLAESRKRYDDALAVLAAIGAGKASLGAQVPQALPVTGGLVVMVSPRRVFGGGVL
jgi:phage gp36-like protein